MIFHYTVLRVYLWHHFMVLSCYCLSLAYCICMHWQAHVCVHTHNQDAFQVLFTTTSHCGKRGSHNGVDWYRLLVEKSHFRWRKQLDTKRRKTAVKPATGQSTRRWPEAIQPTRILHIQARHGHLNSVPLKLITFFSHSCLSEMLQPTHRHFKWASNLPLASSMMTNCTIENYSGSVGKEHQHTEAPINWLLTERGRVKDNENLFLQKWQDCACLMTVNKDHAFFKDRSSFHTNQLFTHVQGNSLAVQLSEMQNHTPTWPAFIAELTREKLMLPRVIHFTKCVKCTTLLLYLNMSSQLTLSLQKNNMYTYTVPKRIKLNIKYHNEVTIPVWDNRPLDTAVTIEKSWTHWNHEHIGIMENIGKVGQSAVSQSDWVKTETNSDWSPFSPIASIIITPAVWIKCLLICLDD